MVALWHKIFDINNNKRNEHDQRRASLFVVRDTWKLAGELGNRSRLSLDRNKSLLAQQLYLLFGQQHTTEYLLSSYNNNVI